MSDSVFDRFNRPAAKAVSPLAFASVEPGPEELDDYGAFGWLRGVRDKAIMLELRKKDGSVRAFGYAWLQEVDLDPSKEITLCLPCGKIKIIGRNLNVENKPNIRLFQGIVRHKVPFVQEADEVASMKARDGDTIVECIAW
ncbi:MAG: hypothetical protein JSS49_28895 [Planctomycetes bacterium]|nr:hypothetical protein [Planctomycetota bacterium]